MLNGGCLPIKSRREFTQYRRNLDAVRFTTTVEFAQMLRQRRQLSLGIVPKHVKTGESIHAFAIFHR